MLGIKVTKGITFQDIFVSDIRGLHIHHDGPFMVLCIIMYTVLRYISTKITLSSSCKSVGLYRVYSYLRPNIPFPILFAYLLVDCTLGLPLPLYLGVLLVLLLFSCVVAVSNEHHHLTPLQKL